VLAKQELRPVEKTLSIAETLVLGEALLDNTLDYVSAHAAGKIRPGTVPLPSGVRSSLAACRTA
jgi:hypothetical protein